MERNCQKCIHHISGSCCKWNCEMQTLEDYRNKVIDEFADRLKSESYNGYATLEDYCEDTIESVAVEDIVRIAEQMKAGGKNERDFI